MSEEKTGPNRTTEANVNGDATKRRPYVAPSVLRRGTVRETTLVSGNECVLDPPGSC